MLYSVTNLKTVIHNILTIFTLCHFWKFILFFSLSNEKIVVEQRPQWFCQALLRRDSHLWSQAPRRHDCGQCLSWGTIETDCTVLCQDTEWQHHLTMQAIWCHPTWNTLTSMDLKDLLEEPGTFLHTQPLHVPGGFLWLWGPIASTVTHSGHQWNILTQTLREGKDNISSDSLKHLSGKKENASSKKKPWYKKKSWSYHASGKWTTV